MCIYKKSNGFMHAKQSYLHHKYTTIKSLNLFDRHVSWSLYIPGSKHTSASGQCCVDRWCMNYNIAQQCNKN